MKKWLLGLAIIAAGVLAYLVIPYFDSDDSTIPDVAAAAAQVQKGVTIIRNSDSAASTATEAGE